MKIVVIGGTGLIGKQVVSLLRAGGHVVVAASPSTGVNTLTGEGLAAAFAGADVVVDVANSPSFADEPVMAFFRTAGTNIAAAERAAGVKHHVALSVVGADRAPDSGYLRAKVEQEAMIRASGIPFTILRATQFYEFVAAIAAGAGAGDPVRATSATLQPIAAADVAAAVAEAAVAAPTNAINDIAGPERIGIDALIRQHFAAVGDPRTVISDRTAGYFGAVIDDGSLTPNGPARLSTLRFADWLAK